MMRRYLVADLFCGAGGSSTGCARAIRAIGGELVIVCVNHDKTAIATHRKNHPTARHYIEDLNGADPERIVPERRLDLLMASPECRFHSRARGGKPINDQLRMSAYAIQRWLTALNVRCLLVENVPEFIEWGPLCTLETGHAGIHVHDPLSEPAEACDLPDPARKRVYFEAWLRNIWELGYQFDWRILNAADFGDATTRERFFLQARKDGRAIQWPEPSHAKARAGGMFGHLKPWRAAREVIDWDDTGRSLLDDPKYQKAPLSPKTRMRIARGLARFGGPLAPLYIDLLGIDPCGVSVPPGRGQKPQAFVFANRTNNAPRSVDESPVPAITTSPSGGGNYLVNPAAEPFVLGQQAGSVARPTGEPLPTIARAGYITLTTPFLIGQHTNNVPKGVDESPVPTIMVRTMIRLIQPMLAPYYGSGSGETCQSVAEPVPTIPTHDRFGLVNPLAVPYGPRAEARSIDEPLPTIMTKDRLAVATPMAEPFIVSRQGHNDPSGRVRPVSAPLSTITGSGSGTGYLVEPFIVPKFGEREGQAPRVHSVEDPLPTVTGVGAGRLVQPYIVEPVLRAVDRGAVDPRRVVLIDGEPYLLDIRFRMLKNRELARAMGFDDGESQYEFTGTQSQITKQIGNAVCVNLSAALVGAILGPQVSTSAGDDDALDPAMVAD